MVRQMPLYVYNCEACKTRFELRQSIKEPLPTICPDCNSTEFYQEFGIGIMATVSGRTSGTLGSLADKNSKLLSDEQKAELTKTKRLPGKELPSGMTRIERKPCEKRWYDDAGNASIKQITKMTSEQQTKYIINGTI